MWDRVLCHEGQCNLPAEAVGAAYCFVTRYTMYLLKLAKVKERERFLM